MFDLGDYSSSIKCSKMYLINEKDKFKKLDGFMCYILPDPIPQSFSEWRWCISDGWGSNLFSLKRTQVDLFFSQRNSSHNLSLRLSPRDPHLLS